MINSLFILWISILIADLLPQQILILIPIATLVLGLFKSKFLYHPLPYGIEYKSNLAFDYTSILLVSSLSILNCIIYISPALSTGILVLALGICQICVTKDWFNLYIGFEIMLVGVILIFCQRNWKNLIKYFRIQILGTLILLFGIVKMYSMNTNLSIGIVKYGNLFVPIGLCIKCGLYPFSWIISCYKTNDKLIYFILITIVSKVTLYVLSLICSLDKISYRFILIIITISLIYNMYSALKAKSVEGLCIAATIGSISYTGLILLFDMKFLFIYYLLYTFIIQGIFLVNPFISLIIQIVPILNFIFKIILLKSIKSRLLQLIILLNNLIFTYYGLQQIIKIFIRTRRTKLKSANLIEYRDKKSK